MFYFPPPPCHRPSDGATVGCTAALVILASLATTVLLIALFF